MFFLNWVTSIHVANSEDVQNGAEPLWIPIEFAIEFAMTNPIGATIDPAWAKKYLNLNTSDFFTSTPQNCPKTWVLWPENGRKWYWLRKADTGYFRGCNAGEKWYRNFPKTPYRVAGAGTSGTTAIVSGSEYWKANTRQIRQKTSFFKYYSVVPRGHRL